MMHARRGALLFCAALAVWTRSAHAEGPVWAVPVGVNLGFGIHKTPVPTGAILGLEASFVLMVTASDKYFSVPTFWGGAYVDGLFDTGASRGRFSIGPEFGYEFFGLDAGVVAQVGGGVVRAGGCIRPMLTVSLITIYVRGTFVPSDPEVDQTTEIGLLLKWPLSNKKLW